MTSLGNTLVLPIKYKTGYVKCKFSKRQMNSNLYVRNKEHTIPQISHFKYIASII